MKKYKSLLGLIIFGGLLIVLTIYLIPKIKLLQIEENKEAFLAYVKSLGLWGYIILISLNCLQVVVAILPGELFEVFSGIVYGPWLGLLCVELGIALAVVIIILIIRAFNFKSNKLKEKLEGKKIYQIIKDSKRLEVIIFFLTIIPCLPKDIIVYAVAFSDLKLCRFLVINAIARIPSIIASTYFGASLLDGNYKLAIIIFGVQALVGLIGLIFNKKIVEKLYHSNKNTEIQS